MKLKLLICMITALSLTACGPSREEIAKQQGAEIAMTGELTNADYENVAKQLIADALANELEKPKADGGKYVLALGKIENNTMQRISPKEIVSKMRIALQRSGKMYVVNIDDIGEAGKRADSLAMSKYVRQDTVTQVNAISYDKFLKGSISQKDVEIGNNVLVEYTFNFVLRDESTMLTMWEGDITVKKVISKDMVNW